MSRIIQYTADDEEPECRNCNNQDGQKVCENADLNMDGPDISGRIWR